MLNVGRKEQGLKNNFENLQLFIKKAQQDDQLPVKD